MAAILFSVLWHNRGCFMGNWYFLCQWNPWWEAINGIIGLLGCMCYMVDKETQQSVLMPTIYIERFRTGCLKCCEKRGIYSLKISQHIKASVIRVINELDIFGTKLLSESTMTYFQLELASGTIWSKYELLHSGAINLKMLPTKCQGWPFCSGLNTLRPRRNGRHLQSTFSNVFSRMKMYEFRLKCHWSLFLRVQLTKFQHWFR